MYPRPRRRPESVGHAVLLHALLAVSGIAFADDGVPVVAHAGAATLPPTPAPVPAPCHCAPAGTLVAIEIDELLVSDERKPGEGFALHLAEPIVVDGTTLVPAGTPGHGEIIHAAKARGGGQPGELTLAARFLDADGHRIALRGMKYGAAGADRAGAALATAIAVGVFAEFIHGGEVRIPPGTRASAKLAVSLDSAFFHPSDGTAAPTGAASPSTASETATQPTQE